MISKSLFLIGTHVLASLSTAQLKPSRVITRTALENIGNDDQIEIYDEFINDEEIKHILQIGQSGTKQWGMHHMSEMKNYMLADPVYTGIVERVAVLTGIPYHAEEISYFKRKVAGDNLLSTHHDTQGRPLRVMTVIIYLSDVPEPSGALDFPCFGGPDGRGDPETCGTLMRVAGEGYGGLASHHPSSMVTNISNVCAKKNPSEWFRFQPKRGTAVKFRVRRPDGELVRSTWHTPCNLEPEAPAKVFMQFFKEWPTGDIPEKLKEFKRTQTRKNYYEGQSDANFFQTFLYLVVGVVVLWRVGGFLLSLFSVENADAPKKDQKNKPVKEDRSGKRRKNT